MHQTQSKSFNLFCSCAFSVAAVPQKREQASVCFSATGETCYSGVASGKNRLVCFLLKARSSQYFLGGYTVWQQQLNRQSRRMS